METHLSASAVDGGFEDPVFGSQSAFRRIMDAFARPGAIADLSGLAEGPHPLTPAAAVILATLADDDAAVFLDFEAAAAATGCIAFQTGASVLAEPEGAAFAVLCGGSDPATWGRFPIGTDLYPDRSATLILPVASLDGGAAMRLSGPGIETQRIVAPSGLPAGFAAYRAENRSLFPRGQDLILVSGTRCLALPRTTRVEEI